MCSGGILLFQIARVVVGEAESFAGDLGFLTGRGVDVVLLGDRGCVAVMQEFQRRYPEVWSEDIGGREPERRGPGGQDGDPSPPAGPPTPSRAPPQCPTGQAAASPAPA